MSREITKHNWNECGRERMQVRGGREGEIEFTRVFVAAEQIENEFSSDGKAGSCHTGHSHVLPPHCVRTGFWVLTL